MADVTVPERTPIRSGPQEAGFIQGLLLVSMSCLSVLGAVLLSPVLPDMQRHFAGTPGVAVLVPVTLTVPALMIGILAPGAGSVVDRLGRKRLLVASLVAYGLLGMAPLVVDSLPLIVLTRVGVGVTEAAIMTCCTTLIVDYFDGAERHRWLGMQTVAAAVAAVAFFALGGALGSLSWRTPFWLYASAFAFAVLAARFVWQPVTPVGERVLPAFPWRPMLVPVLITVFAGVVFYAPIVEVSYVLAGIGQTSTAVVGAVGALASLATAAGGIAFGRLRIVRTRRLLNIAFSLAGVGLMVFAVAPALPLAVVGVVIACSGTGLLLPTLLTWAVGHLSFDERGRGTGLWTSALFIGDFICPLLVLALTGLLGGLSWALVVVGALALLLVPVSRTVVHDA